MYPFYLGIDLHLKKSYVVLINAEGAVIDKRQMRNQELGGYLKEHVPTETYAVMEATRNWPYFYDLLEGHVDRVELAHAKEVRSIATAAVKTDQIVCDRVSQSGEDELSADSVCGVERGPGSAPTYEISRMVGG